MMLNPDVYLGHVRAALTVPGQEIFYSRETYIVGNGAADHLSPRRGDADFVEWSFATDEAHDGRAEASGRRAQENAGVYRDAGNGPGGQSQ